MAAKTKPAKNPTRVENTRRSPQRQNRIKLSTTVAPENLSFLESLVRSGRTESVAEAVDLAIARFRRMENRLRLERATAAYFDGLSPEAEAEEQEMTRALHFSATDLDFDLEP